MVDVFTPAGAVPQVALAYGTPGATAASVTEDTPLPTRENQTSYQLALNVASLPNTGTNTTGDTSGIVGGSYIWDYVLAGTSPSLALQALASDGSTWTTVATVTASGRQGVVLGNNASVRLKNTGSNAITGLSSSLS